MSRRTYHRGLRLESGTKAAGDADKPWLDDQTTATYRPKKPAAQAHDLGPKKLPLTAARANAPLVAAPQPAATTRQIAEAALARFWSAQDQRQRARILQRALEPAWVRVLASCLGIAMCVMFGWVLVTGLSPANPTPLNLPTSVSGTTALEIVPPLTAELPGTQPAAAASMSPAEAPLTAAYAHTPTPAGHTKSQRRGKTRRQDHEAPLATSSSSESGRSATLRLNSQPWSEVFVDGKPVGRTPQPGISLPPGVHSVRLYNAQRNLLKLLTLHVLPGETIERVEQLEP